MNGRPGLFVQECFEHFVGNELVARFVQMDPVEGQDAGLFVTRVVLEFVVVEDLVEVDESAVEFLGQVTDDLGIGVKVSVLLIGKIGLFANDGRCAKEDADMSVEEFIDDRDVEFLEFVDIRAGAGQGLMPDIVYADKNENDVGILCEDIVVHTEIKIVHFIAPDAGSCERIVIGKVFLGQGIGHFYDEAAWLCPCLGDRITEKDDFLGFVAEGSKCVEDGQQEQNNGNSREGSHCINIFLTPNVRENAQTAMHPSARMISRHALLLW